MNKSRGLVIELSRHTVTVIDRRGRVASTDKPPGEHGKVEISDAASLTSRLQERLAHLDLAPPITATVCLPRNLACMRIVEIPPIGNRELASVVDLELEAAFGEENEQYISDFINLPASGDSAQYAIIYSVPKRVLDSLQLALFQSQINVERITLSDFAYSRGNDSSKLVQVLALSDNVLHLLICYRGVVVQSQAFTIDPNNSCEFTQYRGALRRLQSSLPESMRGSEPTSELLVRRLHSNDDHDAGSCFQRSLVEQCSANGFRVEEYRLPELFNALGRPETRNVDFADPKRAAAPLLSQRSLIAMVCACVLLTVSGIYIVKRREAAGLVEQIGAVRKQLAATEEQLNALAGKVDSAARLRQWDEGTVDWNEHIRAISQQITPSNDLYLVRLQMDNRNFWERKPVTRMEGRAKSPSTILNMTRRLGTENPSLSVQPNGIEPNSVDPDYGSQFRVEIEEATALPQTEINRTKDQ